MNEKIKEDIANIVNRMPRYGKLIYKLYRDPLISKKQKAILSVGLAYAVSPIDLIPGFIPVVGQLDDIVVALTALVKVLKEIPAVDRTTYISEFELTMREIEGDLAASKNAMYYLTGKAVNYAGKGAKYTGKTIVKLTVKGIYSLIKKSNKAFGK
ncbi:YkvA family protein [Desulfolucanica intricata]|uniref:YkvA family protein n=1 Tax=Desulfolucanica intricata TaxID=1285191 RepID=UPI000836B0E1|nr:DUF1232 domain-containing protein [Desulfolucanica intricata]